MFLPALGSKQRQPKAAAKMAESEEGKELLRGFKYLAFVLSFWTFDTFSQ